MKNMKDMKDMKDMNCEIKGCTNKASCWAKGRFVCRMHFFKLKKIKPEAIPKRLIDSKKGINKKGNVNK